jgi:large subunit ribosomal protein L30
MAKKKGKMLRITLVKSPIGYSQRHKDTVRTLGLKRINQAVEHEDGPVLQGMLYKIAHLVRVEEI